MNDVMLDLETFGTGPGCAVRSIGAVFFDLTTGVTGPRFYANIDLKSCLDRGLTIDPQTVLWWTQQSAEAQQALTGDGVPIMDAAGGFDFWFRSNKGGRVWCQGASFDVPIWEAAIGRPGPWKFYDVRDTRTLYDLAEVFEKPPRQGTHHNAVDDAIYQIACCHVAYTAIKNKG